MNSDLGKNISNQLYETIGVKAPMNSLHNQHKNKNIS
jgi:hypothetical protein